MNLDSSAGVAVTAAMRYGEDLKTPFASIQGPKVMIIDETAGSGGDLLPWMFRKFKMGPLVGKRTWGGLVGVLGFPVLIEMRPADVIAGRDPQLEKAIEVTLAELKKNPPKTPKRPADAGRGKTVRGTVIKR